jgi:hypothetical protein
MILTRFTICANCVSKNQDGTLERPIPDLQLFPDRNLEHDTCRICGSAEQPTLMAAEAPERQVIRSSNRRWLRQIRNDLSTSAQTKTKATFDRCPTCGKRSKR